MESEGHRCTSIRGDMDNELRDKVVNEFRNGTTKILISTDVLSRGFDVTQASHRTLTPLRLRNMCSSIVTDHKGYSGGEGGKCCLYYWGSVP